MLFRSKSNSDIVSVAMIGTSGGTTINNVVHSINKHGVNALVITDAEDSCGVYSDKAFFIGIKGAKFNHFKAETIKEYSEKDQVIIFDGSSIKRVGPNGREIV